MKKSNITLISHFGGTNYHLIPHFFDYYHGLGITDFYIIAANEPPVLQQLEQLHRKPDIIDTEEYTVQRRQHYLNERISQGKINEWFLLTDMDEFCVFRQTLPETIRMLEDGDYVAMCGYFIDRHAEDGVLLDLNDVSNLWSAFPYCSQITKEVSFGNYRKMVLVKSGNLVGRGHHSLLDRKESAIHPGPVEVHHFKWDSTVIPRLLKRCHTKMIVEERPHIAQESLNFLHMLTFNKNRIPLRLVHAMKNGGFYNGTLKPLAKPRLRFRIFAKIIRLMMQRQ